MNTHRGLSFRKKLLVAPVTPFHSNGELHCELIARQGEIMMRREVDGFFIGGRTGEGLSMSVEERKRVAQCWREATESLLIVSVGHSCLRDARDLAAHAESIGADATSSEGGAGTYPNTRLDDLVDWCGEIAGCAPGLPYFYYHNSGSAPGLENMDSADFCRLALERIPNFAGVKFSDHALHGAMSCARIDPARLDVFLGKDEMLLGGLAMGMESVIGGTYNLLSPLARGIMSAFDEGDMRRAQDCQSKMNQCISIFGKHGGLVGVKAAMTLIGLDCGPVRRPLHNLDAVRQQSLMESLRAVAPELWAVLDEVRH
jgi:N-acetylneuraminate lyase